MTAPTMHSDGRWFGWHWKVPVPPPAGTTRDAWIGTAITGYAFTAWGARRAVRHVLRRQQRERTVLLHQDGTVEAQRRTA